MHQILTRTSLTSVPDAILRSGILHNVPPAFVDMLLAQARLCRAEAGTMLFMQDQDALALHIVASGWIKLFRETLAGDEAIFDILTVGDLLGVINGTGAGRHHYSASAITDVTFYALPLSLVAALLEQCPQLAINLIDIHAQARHQQSLDLEHERLQTAPQRLGCFLLRLCRDHTATSPKVLHMPIDKGLIAARLGMKPETFSRALAALKAEVHITVQGATITIPDVRLLSDRVCGHCSAGQSCID